MTVSEITGIVGAVFGFIGVALAIYENRSRARLSNYIRAQNWHLYSKSNNANGSVQLALEKYKAGDPEKIDLEVLELLSKADAFGQDVFKDIIKQIHYAEPVYSRDLIERWERNGRITKASTPLFLALTPANRLSKKLSQSNNNDKNNDTIIDE